MQNFKVIHNLPVIPGLYNYFTDMVNNGLITIPVHDQICLNAPKGKEDDYKLGTGSLYIDWEKIDPDKLTSKENLPVRDVIYEEDDFTELCTVFVNTPFEKLFTELTNNYNIGRVRIMINLPKTCLSWHTDSTPRLHYPIKTQDGCFMVIEDEIYHLPENQWTFTNTTVKHTAFNGSFDKRIHIVATILDKHEN